MQRSTDFSVYTLQRFIGDQLISDYRVRFCCRVAAFGAQSVSFHLSTDTLKMRGLMYCSSIWTCPVCSVLIRKNRVAQVQSLFESSIAAGYSLHFVTLTFTLQHDRKNCDAMITAQSGAWRLMTGSRAYKLWRKQNQIVHYMRALEITHGAAGWHPHYHLVFASRTQDFDYALLFQFWTAAVTLQGGVSVLGAQNYQFVQSTDVLQVAQYTSAWGAGIWNISSEIVASKTRTRRIGSRTPMQLAADAMMGDSRSAALFKEYAHATKGMRANTFSRGWLALINIDDVSETIDPAIVDGELILSITTSDFKKLGAYREKFFQAVLIGSFYELQLVAQLKQISLYNLSHQHFKIPYSTMVINSGGNYEFL